MEPERLRPHTQGPEPDVARPRRDLGRPADDDLGASASSGSSATDSPSSTGSTTGAAARPARTSTPRETQPKPKAGSGGKFLIAAILAVLLAIGYFMFGQGPGKSDALASETQSPAYQKHKLASPGARMSLSRADLNPQVTKAAVEAAKAGQPIPGLSGASPELVNHIAAGDVEFYTVRAYDTCAEDGDWITITSSNGAKLGSVMMTNAGT